MKKKMHATINWSRSENMWNVRLWSEYHQEWVFVQGYPVKKDKENNVDYVNDDILCGIASLQEEGYEVTVTC